MPPDRYTVPPDEDYEPNSTMTQKGYDNYIQAIHRGVLGDYEMMQKVFLELLQVS